MMVGTAYKLKALIVFIFISCSTVLWSQNQFVIQHFTQKNGLPQNSVNQLYFDQNYFLWIATESGIVRFDGINFYTFSNTNKQLVDSERFRWILPSPNKKQYISNANGKLFEIVNNQVFEVPNTNNSQNLSYVTGGIPDLEQILYFKNAGSNKTKNWNFFPARIIPISQQVFYVLGFQYVYKYKNFELIDSLNISNLGNVVQFFKIENQYYVLNQNGVVYLLDFNKKTSIICKFDNNKIFNKSNFKIIYKAHDKHVFLLNENKIYKLKKDSNNPTLLFGKLITNQVPTGIEISDIEYNDSLNIMAIGSKTEGLFVLKPKLFNNQHIHNSNKNIANTFYAIAIKNDSTVYSTLQYEFTNNRAVKNNVSDKTLNLEAIYILKNKKIYFGLVDSLFVTDLVTKKTSLVNVFGEIITCINGSGDSIWVGTNRSVFLLKNQKIKCLNVSSKVQCIYIDSTKNVYFSNCNGLHQIAVNKSTINYKTIIANECIRDIYLHKNLLFATSYGSGLFVVFNNKVYKLPQDRNNYIAKCHSIQVDLQNRIWISTNNGIFQTIIKRITNFIEDTTQVYQYHYFDEQNGIENSEFNGGCYPASLQFNDGKIFFPSMGGLVSFNPNNFLKRTFFKAIYLDKIVVDNKQIPISKQIVLNSDVENLSLYLSSPFWYNSYEVSYQYQLVGFNSKLIELNDTKLPINFTNLSPGEYTLYIKKNGGNQYYDAETRISIIVLKKYYQTWWFSVLVIFMFIALTILSVIFYNKILWKQNVILEKKVNQRTAELALINNTLHDTNKELLASQQTNIRSINLKQKLIAILTHDIITPLKFISMVARNSAKVSKEHEYQNVLNEIDHTSKRLYDNAQNILNWIKYQSSLIKVQKTNVALYSVTDYAIELLLDFTTSKNNEIINNIDPDQIIFTDKNIISIVIQNLISNAVKYNTNTKIEITSKITNEYFYVSIKDNGSGISKANLVRINEIKDRQNAFAMKDNSQTSGLGFIIITELLNILNGTFELDSNENGTNITVIIPIN